jgi:5'-3' exonuclease
LAKQAEKEGFQVFMVTPDKDFAQLVSENIFMYKPARMGNDIEIWGIPEVLEKFEIERPDQVIDFLGMMGDAADNINTILSYASRNGLGWTKKEATAAVADAYRNSKTMDSIKSKIKNLSKFKYQNLSTLLSENDNIDIYDLGQSYGSLKSQILELGDAEYSVFDPDIQAALSNNGKPGLMTETEFRQILKKKPEWRKTKNAREEAANYANDILRSFGLMA